MRVTTTSEQAAKIAKILGITDLPEGATLTVTCPKNQAGRACACGCGATTSGGTWVPGHDAKRKSELYAAIRSGDESLADAAYAELSDRGWPFPVLKAAKTTDVPEDATV